MCILLTNTLLTYLSASGISLVKEIGSAVLFVVNYDF